MSSVRTFFSFRPVFPLGKTTERSQKQRTEARFVGDATPWEKGQPLASS